VHCLFDLEQWQDAVNRAKAAATSNQGDREYMQVGRGSNLVGGVGGAAELMCVAASLSPTIHQTQLSPPLHTHTNPSPFLSPPPPPPNSSSTKPRRS